MSQPAGLRDFDFLRGPWNIHNKRKKVSLLTDDPLGNKDAIWEEFPATGGMAEKQLDGRVVIDHYDSTFPSGQRVQGLTIRAFDLQTQNWSIAWLDNRQPPDFAPLIGAFHDGVGQFYQAMTLADGRSLHVRFTWDKLTENSARWQQAFSLDSGGTWDTNWVMEFSR